MSPRGSRDQPGVIHFGSAVTRHVAHRDQLWRAHGWLGVSAVLRLLIVPLELHSLLVPEGLLSV